MVGSSPSRWTSLPSNAPEVCSSAVVKETSDIATSRESKRPAASPALSRRNSCQRQHPGHPIVHGGQFRAMFPSDQPTTKYWSQPVLDDGQGICHVVGHLDAAVRHRNGGMPRWNHVRASKPQSGRAGWARRRDWTPARCR